MPAPMTTVTALADIHEAIGCQHPRHTTNAMRDAAGSADCTQAQHILLVLAVTDAWYA